MTDANVAAYLSTKIYSDLKEGQNFGESNRFLVLKEKNDPITGYYGAIIKDSFTGEAILVNRGTNELTDHTQANLDIALGHIADNQMAVAYEFYNNYKNSNGAIPITSSVGHSLGGFLAQLMGISQGLDVVAIGSPGVTEPFIDLIESEYMNTSYIDPSRISVYNDPRDPVASHNTQLSGINYHEVDLDPYISRTTSALVTVGSFFGFDELTMWDVGTYYLVPITHGGHFVVSLAYHDKLLYHDVITGNFNNANNSLSDTLFGVTSNGYVVTTLGRVTLVDKPAGDDAIFYEHTDGNFYVFQDNPDGTKIISYTDSNGNQILKSFESFTNTSNLNDYEDFVVTALAYQYYKEFRAKAEEVYRNNPDIINSPEFNDYPEIIRDRLLELHERGETVASENDQENGIIEGGEGNDILQGAQGAQGLGAGSEDFDAKNLIYIIQNGTKSDSLGAAVDLYNLIETQGVYNEVSKSYSFGDYKIEAVQNEYGGEATRITVLGIPQAYITNYSEGNFQQKIIETVGFDGRTTNARIILADGLVNQIYSGDDIDIKYPENFVFSYAGGYIGNLIGQQLENGELAHDLITSAIMRTAGSNIGEVLDFLATGENSLSEALFDPIFGVDGTNQVRLSILDDFLINLQSGVVNLISNKILEEIGDVIEIDGIGGEIFNVVGNTVTTGILNESFGLLFSGLDGGVYTGILSGQLNFSSPYPPNTQGITGTVGDYVQAQVFNALASYAGSRLAGEVITPESETAAFFGAAGSALGTAIASGQLFASYAIGSAFKAIGTALGGPVGIVIGAFIGQVIGTFAGNLLGSDDEPEAWAIAGFDKNAMQYTLRDNWASDGGDPLVARSLAEQAIDGVNQIIAASHGKLRSGSIAPRILIGMEGNDFVVSVSGQEEKVFGTAADAVMHAAFKIMSGFDLVGGHAVVMRAWHNSEATNIHEWLEDIQVAEAFQNYLANPTAILALMMNDPESELAQSWATILQRAAELELHLPHEKDLDGGWAEVLYAQGVDPESIPSIEGTSLTVTNPVTGEETVMHHIIGPGYEIVRIEGTDGNDIIEVIVDGPSISYVDAGAGDDTVEGSDQADVIVGGAGDDIINGYEGNDWLHGGAGDDTIDGGAGEDLVVGGDDDDYLIGGADTDHIYGNGGNDILYSGGGIDWLYGGEGNDTLVANSQDSKDYLYGGEGDDILVGNGRAEMYGGKGNDFYDNSQDLVGNTIVIYRDEGHDIVKANSNVVTTLTFDQTIGMRELVFKNDNGDLKIHVLGEKQTITVEDYFSDINLKLAIHALNGWYWLGNGTDSRGAVTKMVEKAEHIIFTDEYNHASETDLIILEESYDLTSKWAHKDITHIATQITQGTTSDDPAIWLHHNSNVFAMGGAGNDYITSNTTSPQRERMYGDSGNDTMHGNNGTDYMMGGLGNDFIAGGYGDDTIFGGHGNDAISGNYGSDHISGGEGEDSIYGGSENDTIYGDDQDDLIHGENGEDKLYGGQGNDTIYGEDDIDFIQGNEGDDWIDGGEGDDWIDGGEGDDWIDGGEGNDNIIGKDGDDNLNGSSGEDYIYGDSGDDNITGGAGADYIEGGIGNDTIYAGTEDDEIYGGDGNDWINGGDGNDIIRGGDGDDSLYGGNGNDQLYSNKGNNFVAGGQGFDTLYLSNFYNNYNLFIGIDSLIVTSLDDTESHDVYHDVETIYFKDLIYYGGQTYSEEECLDLDIFSSDEEEQAENTNYIYEKGDGQFSLSDFTNTNNIKFGSSVTVQNVSVTYTSSTLGALINIHYSDLSDDLITITNDEYLNSYLEYIELYDGTKWDTYASFIQGNNETNDVLYGEDTNDYIASGNGNDKLYGGSGNDLFYGGSGNDQIYGDNGDDIFLVRGGTDKYYGGEGNDTAWLAAGPVNGIYYSGNPEKVKLDLADNIIIQDGKGVVNNHYIEGVENIVTGLGNDVIRGDANNNIISTGSGNDFIDARAGEDRLIGGAGIDTLYGGTEADIFVFDDLTFNGVDIIEDFSVTEGDQLDISALLENYLSDNDYDIQDIINLVQITDNGTDSFLSVDIAGTGSNFQQVAQIKNVTGMTDEVLLASNETLII